MTSPFIVEVGLASSTQYLPWLRRFVAAWGAPKGPAQLSPQGVWRCTVALIEAVNNAVIHAHRRDATRPIWLRCTLRDGMVQLRVRDSGRPFFPQWVKMPAVDRDGGRGLYLMHAFMDDVRYRRWANGNEIELTYNEKSRSL